MRSSRNVTRSTSEDAHDASPSPDPAHDRGPSKRSLRGRSGCLNCRRRRKKCDELKPTCAKCERLGEDCEWDSGLSFRFSSLESNHPSMIAGRKVAAAVTSMQIVDVVFDSTTHECKEYMNGQELSMAAEAVKSPITLDQNPAICAWDLDSISNTDLGALPHERPTSARRHTHASISSNTHHFNDLHSHTEHSTHDNSNSIFQDLAAPLQDLDSISRRATLFETPRPPDENPPSASSLPVIREDDQLLSFTIPELESLDYLTDRAAFQAFGDSLWPPLSNEEANALMDVDHVPVESPDMYAMYYPNATYRELHTTLYNHMVDVAKGTGLTRPATPDSNKSANDSNMAIHDTNNHTSRWDQTSAKTSGTSNLPKGMTVRREMELWRNYLDEIARWLDMFDNELHFRVQLPLLARTSEHLRLSVLALSARQIERRDPNKPYTESLALYQEAIRLIATELESMSTEVIASCVLLCVLEMMSSSPKDWTRHLNGAAMLIKAAGINGVVGGMRQAIFWCFARMDMWGGFLSGSNTKIPTSLWFLPTGSMSTAISKFKTDFQNSDSYANYSLFLCASVLNVVSSRADPTERGGTYGAKWKALFDLLVDWHNNRPREMQPLAPRATEKGDEGPFPIILYTNAAAISANQLYHTAMLLMLQAKPGDIKVRGQKSILWHARQAIGISVSNLSHSAWTNALQPIYIAAKVMSSKAEHQVVLETLSEIESATGFATQWRAQDLRDYWGDEAD